MIRIAMDENFDRKVTLGLRRLRPELDIVQAQEAGLAGADDPTILEWAAREGRVLVTYDLATIDEFAMARVLAGRRMPGVFKMTRSLPRRHMIEEILLLADCSYADEWEGQIRYLPL
jgi:hypothetical protein